jgi:hypothetical protein
VLVAEGDGPRALAAYRRGLAIAEALAARDPAKTQWQTDVAVSCAKLGVLDYGTGCGSVASFFASRKRDLAEAQVCRAAHGQPGLDRVV